MQFVNMLNASGDYSHTFVQYMSNDQGFCEYCYGKAVNWEDAQAMYRCESCGYYCHKLCRNSVNVSCVKASANLNIDHGTAEVQTEKLKKIEEKIQAIQKEIDIELKIRDGLDKMVKAKVHLAGKSSKKGKDDADVASQLDRSNKKLEVLKHEYKKYKLQLDEAQKAVTAEMFPSTENLIEGVKKILEKI
jgi:hypothetical protein